jgi:hypothetical protein
MRAQVRTSPAAASHPSGGPATKGAAHFDTPCVGVLFVHGAGDHAQGQTLQSFGNPLIQWMDEWLKRSGEGHLLTVGAGQLLPVRDEDQGPAHVELLFRPRHVQSEHRWLLAESWWDRAYLPPSATDVAKWALTIVPWIVATQFIGPLLFSTRTRTLRDWILFPVTAAYSLAVTIVAVLVLQVLAIAILILSFIPFGPIRSLVGYVQRWISGSAGDLFLVLSSPIQHATLRGHVQRDVEWLKFRGCKKVVVIAHSQGAFVSHGALTDRWAPAVDRFVTFGSGLIRLTEAEAILKNPIVWIVAAAATVSAIVVARALVGIGGQLLDGTSPSAAELGRLAIFAIVAAATVLVPSLSLRLAQARPAILPVLRATLWKDYLASADPVVDGTVRGRLPATVHHVRVQNTGSFLADHSGYWDNPEGFVSLMAMNVAAVDDGLKLLVAPWRRPSVLRRATARRRTRVMVRQAASALVLLLAGVVLIRHGPSIASALRPGVDTAFATWRTLPEPIRGPWVDLLLGAPRPDLLAALVVIAASTLLANRALGLAWKFWSIREWRAELEGQTDRFPMEIVPFAYISLQCLGALAAIVAALLYEAISGVPQGPDFLITHGSLEGTIWLAAFVACMAPGALIARAGLLRQTQKLGPKWSRAVPTWMARIAATGGSVALFGTAGSLNLPVEVTNWSMILSVLALASATKKGALVLGAVGLTTTIASVALAALYVRA